MAGKRIKVTDEDGDGRNRRFEDTVTGAKMTRDQFVRAIERGKYTNYHVRSVNGVKTPVSNPDKSENNNLG